MARYARYQGAIVQDDQLLLIKHRVFEDNSEFWMIPGGGREAGETEEEAVIREMHVGEPISVHPLLVKLRPAMNQKRKHKKAMRFRL